LNFSFSYLLLLEREKQTKESYFSFSSIRRTLNTTNMTSQQHKKKDQVL